MEPICVIAIVFIVAMYFHVGIRIFLVIKSPKVRIHGGNLKTTVFNYIAMAALIILWPIAYHNIRKDIVEREKRNGFS